MIAKALAMWTSATTLPLRKNGATLMSATACSGEGGGWKGKLVARILPPDFESGDFDVLNKPSMRRLDPSELVTIGEEREPVDASPLTPLSDLSSLPKSSQMALMSDEIRWTVLDIYLYPENPNTDLLSSIELPLQVHMNRNTQEDTQSVLARMEISVSKKLESTLSQPERKARAKEKQLKKKLSDHTPSSSTAFYIVSSHENEIEERCKKVEEENQNIGELWKQLATHYAPDQLHLSLRAEAIDSTIPIEVDSCPPSVVAMRIFEGMEGRLYVGVPVVLDFDLLFATHAIVDWYVGGQLVLSDDRCYTPGDADVGKEIALTITPVRQGHDGKGCIEAYKFLRCVEKRPDNAVLDVRREWTLPRVNSDSDTLRVVSFNILADLNAFHDVRGMRPFYPYCKTEFIQRTRRMPVILHELLAYHADLICLQEVDKIVFDSFFLPTLEAKGYQGFYRKKLGSSEGIAMFWSLAVFERATEDEMLSFAIQSLFPAHEGMTCLEDWLSMDAIENLLAQDDELRNIVEKKTGHVMQAATLSLKGSSPGKPRRIMVANTHLFYHPLGGHIRMMQLYVVCHQLEKLRKGTPLVFCGDLNSTADSGAVHLMMHRSVPLTHPSWDHLNTYTWEGNCEKDTSKLQPIKIGFPSSFPSFRSGYDELPPFTHYIREFSGTLDYIWVSQASETEQFGLVPKAAARTLTEEEVQRNVAMPSEVLPSDHVSILCDLEFDRNTSS